jgi:Bacillus/Clostridium GerA spore germination protein.
MVGTTISSSDGSNTIDNGGKNSSTGGMPSAPISPRLDDNRNKLRDIFDRSTDLIIIPWSFGPNLECHAIAIYYDSLVQSRTINFMKYTLQDLAPHEVGQATDVTLQQIIQFYEHHGVSEKKGELVDDFALAVHSISKGCVLLFFDGWDKAISFNALAIETRQVAEPTNESVVMGPRESTVENIFKNIGLLRLRLRTPHFKLQQITAGGETKTEIIYGYVDGAVDPELLNEFHRRMEIVEQLEIMETSYVEQLIEDSSYSPFPQHRYTERPDVAVAAMLDGKIAVLVQGTSGILLCPGLFTEFFQSGEDYYQRTIISSMIRWLRIVSFIIALTLPSIYIALTTFHPELIPTVLLLAVIDAREGIPLPAFFEALVMEFFFELLREAGVRLPRPVGSAVSIVGALVIGDAAISAGIASPIMVIVVALTGIASFTIPQYNIAIALRVLRFPLMISAAFLGGFGMMICLLLMLLHLCQLRSLGQPYLAPLAPLRFKQLRDVLVRAPLKTLLKQPRNRHMHEGGK